jgi:hypothetical protein
LLCTALHGVGNDPSLRKAASHETPGDRRRKLVSETCRIGMPCALSFLTPDLLRELEQARSGVKR